MMGVDLGRLIGSGSAVVVLVIASEDMMLSFGPAETGVEAPELGLEENPNPGRERDKPERKLVRR